MGLGGSSGESAAGGKAIGGGSFGGGGTNNAGPTICKFLNIINSCIKYLSMST